MPATLLPILPYGDLPSRWGVALERQPWGLRVIVPPVPGWSHLPKPYLWILLPCWVLAMNTWAWIQGAKASEIAPPMVMYGVLCAGIMLRAVWRLGCRTIIDVTRDELAIVTVGASGRGHRSAWSIKAVGEVKTTASHEKLLVRITGKDLIEYFVSSNREVTRWVADEVNRALVDAACFGPEANESFPRLSRESYRGQMLVAMVCIALFVLPGVIGMVHTGGGALCMTFGAIGGLVIYAGITMGTQDREFYF